ncbi:MAG: NUDIX domain-containing protein [Candidatus Omnitrophota bacterium]|nr:NUDIX domain-containing protein [Candidatus Omnitrophota bacterium]
MNKEFSAGAMVFKREGNGILFLIVYSKRNKLWGFPKGHLEQGESVEQAAAREIKEETGLGNLEFINGFKEDVMYETVSKRLPFKGQKIEKYVTYFLCEIKNQDIIVDGREIGDYKFLPLDKAEEQIKFRNLDNILRKAYDFLQVL